jgi:hypothetical protein
MVLISPQSKCSGSLQAARLLDLDSCVDLDATEKKTGLFDETMSIRDFASR